MVVISSLVGGGREKGFIEGVFKGGEAPLFLKGWRVGIDKIGG